MIRSQAGRVAVITGGGNGIGSASALELSRQGATVVVVDPGVGVQGEDLKEPTAAETANRIRAEGGTAFDSMVSVTDRDALENLFRQVRRELGSLDIVVNTAGIVRYPALADTSEDDWDAVLDVHLNGYLNVLSSALPIMIAAGYGRVVGITSGMGLTRTTGANVAYGCAKRAVANLTWEIGPRVPTGVNVNALSPIAATRMVRHALAGDRADPAGLDLSAMPQAEDMAPAVAYLAGDRLERARGHVWFSAGSELSLIAPPKLVEAVRTEGVEDFGSALGTLIPVILGPAEQNQRTGGGSNPRLGDVFGPAPAVSAERREGGRCLVVCADRTLAAAVAAGVSGWGMTPIDATPGPVGFDEVDQMLVDNLMAGGPVAAVVVVTSEEPPSDPSWLSVIETHRSVVARVLEHAAWLRAGARMAIRSGRPLRVIHLVGATTVAGRTSAQAVTQMARSAVNGPPHLPVDAFSISLETADRGQYRAIGQLIGRLAATEDGRTLRGAELVVADGWAGLRAHPVPTVTVTFGGPSIPASVDGALSACL